MPTSIVPVCRAVTKRYSRFELGPIDLSVGNGRVTGLFGPNGSGKTTLLSMILGLIRPTSGDIYVGGDNGLRCTSAVLEGVGMLPDVTVVRYLEMTAKLHKSDAEPYEVAVYCGIDCYLSVKVRHLSMGNRQRLSIACLMLSETTFAIFDEPLNGLDPDGIRWFTGVLREMKQEGKSIILSSHLLMEAHSLIDDCIFLSEGKVIYSGSLSEIEKRARQSLSVCAEEAAQGDNQQHERVIYIDNGLAYLDSPRSDGNYESHVRTRNTWDQKIPLAAIYAWILHGSYQADELGDKNA